MSRPLTWLLSGAALCLFAASGAATAGEPQPAGAKGEPRVERQVRAMRHMDPAARAQHLRDVLQLRPQQEAALKAFLEATQPKPGERKGFDAAGAGTTPERLAAMEARMAEHQAAMRARIAATRTFYGQLDERQRKAFDALPMMSLMGHGSGHMMGPRTMGAHRGPPPPQPPTPPAPPPSPDA